MIRNKALAAARKAYRKALDAEMLRHYQAKEAIRRDYYKATSKRRLAERGVRP